MQIPIWKTLSVQAAWDVFCAFLQPLIISSFIYIIDAHSEAVQFALAIHKAKCLPVLPIPVKRRSLMVHNSLDDSSGIYSMNFSQVLVLDLCYPALTDDENTDVSTTDDDGSLQRRTDTSSTGGSAVPSPVSTNRSSSSLKQGKILSQVLHVYLFVLKKKTVLFV